MANLARRSFLRRATHSNASTALQPSLAMQRASPRVSSILASYGVFKPGKNVGDATPHVRQEQLQPRPSPSDSSAPATPSSKVVEPSSASRDDLRGWITPHIPILTKRQLELSLIEIRRRNNRRRSRQNGQRASATTAATSSKPSNVKEAAVLVPMCTVQGAPSILFTRRSSQLSSHASQISFPGGHYDEDLDSSEGGEGWKNGLVNTALREMHEELRYDVGRLGASAHAANGYNSDNGSKPPFLNVLGQTQPVPSMTGSKVTPIVGAINYDLPHHATSQFAEIFPGNPEEVDWIFTVPIRDLIATETSEPLRRWRTNYDGGDGTETGGGKREYRGPVFAVPEGHGREAGDKIWGLTAIVLRPLLRRVFRPVFGEDGLGCCGTAAKEVELDSTA